MKLTRLTGWLFLALAGAFLVLDIVRLLDKGGFATRSVGKLWYSIDPTSLGLLQAAIERHIDPMLWKIFFFVFLSLPDWALPGLIGAALVILTSRRKERDG